jgi:hypothetical protein
MFNFVFQATKHKDFYGSAKKEKSVKHPHKISTSGDQGASNNAQPEAVGDQNPTKQAVESTSAPTGKYLIL